MQGRIVRGRIGSGRRAKPIFSGSSANQLKQSGEIGRTLHFLPPRPHTDYPYIHRIFIPRTHHEQLNCRTLNGCFSRANSIRDFLHPLVSGRMAATSAADIPLLIRSENSSSERRISPAWTVAQLKGRLEPITGVPAGCQRLSLKVASQPAQNIEAADEEATQIGAWPLQAYAELQVGDD